MTIRCGTVALIGQPNAGKSTLLNRLLGAKLAIVSSKPQTTRHRIAGILTTPRIQVRLLDTPGIHEPWTELNREMVGRAHSALSEADAAIWLVDATVSAARLRAGEPLLDATDHRVAEALRGSRRPVIFAANKSDVVERLALEAVQAAVADTLPLAGSTALSAATGAEIQALLALVEAVLPEGEQFADPEAWTELPERFLAAEIVREKVFHLTEQEIPYTTHVEVVQFDETERESQQLVRIHMDVVVERPSQKAIVIGKGGEMLKRIGTLARKEIQELLGSRVYLELFVKVERDWTRTANGLRRVGYR